VTTVVSVSGHQGSQLKVLSSGDLTFERMLGAIGRAQRTIHLEVYSFAYDKTGREFIRALTDAAYRSVEVQVLVDAWGTNDAKRVVHELRRGGCKAEIYNPMIAGFWGRVQRDHRKLLVVDDEVAFIGGINISDLFRGEGGWVDLSLEISGAAAYGLASQLRSGKETSSSPELKIVLSRAGARAVRRRYLKAIREAKHRILLAHSYFLPDRRLLRAIRMAARRGVAVSILLPSRSDVPVTHALTRLYYRGLLKAGVHIHEWGPSLLHAKVAAIDGEMAFIGSFNLDPWSLVNLEVLAEVHRSDIAKEIEGWIATRLKSSPTARVLPRSRLGGPLEDLGRGFIRMSWRMSRAVSRWTRGKLP
jgi:cardiolipin synthase